MYVVQSFCLRKKENSSKKPLKARFTYTVYISCILELLWSGMLLELPGAVISQMLQDEALLSNALERALAALHPDTR